MNLQFSFKICHIKVNVPYTILLITFAHALPRALSIDQIKMSRPFFRSSRSYLFAPNNQICYCQISYFLYSNYILRLTKTGSEKDLYEI
jgi:hypothetical protein